jgi:hypothetical protein
MFLHEEAKKTYKWIDGWGVDTIAVMPLFLILLLWVAEAQDPEAIQATFMALAVFSPLWLPIVLFVVFWVIWMRYIRLNFWFSQKSVLLEIQLPPEVEKTPLAMELFLTALWNAGGETTFIQRIWKGQFRATWSLEIASNEGRVSYYMHLRESMRQIVEARLYGQFPEAKVFEVDDYAARVPFNVEEYGAFGAEYKKGSPGPVPIRSYVDYELNKDPDKPEAQVDPLTNTLELLGQVGEGEHYWVQFIVKARKKDEWYGFYRTKDQYLEEGKGAIAKIFEGAIKRASDRVDDPIAKKSVASRGPQLLSEGEKHQVEAIENSTHKLIFECGIRTAYIARKDKFRGVNNGGVIRFFDAYRYPGYNQLGATRGVSYFDYPWQDFAGIRQNIEKHHLYRRYKNREYFYVPYDQEPVFLTTEELATLWHFPSSVVKTPGLQRVASRRSEAPANLPI